MSDSHPARLPDPEKTRQLVSALLRKKGISLPQKEAIPRRPVYSPCPASFAQQRLWLLEQMSPGSRYNMQFVLRLTGPLNTQSLFGAWHEILKRHEILRTTFGVVDDEIVQSISPEPQSSLALMDLTGHDDSERESQVQELLEKQGEEIFDLANGPLVRPVVVKVGTEEYILSLTMHHIIFDGWSLVVLMRELTELYVALDEGRSNPLQPPLLQYADFAYWQRQRLSGDLLETHLSYWRKQLSDAPVLELPTDHPRPRKESFRGSHQAFRIPQGIAERLRELGRRNHASLFMVLLTAWQVLMYRYSSQSDVVVGVTIANRTRVEIEALIGFFVNTLVLRSDLSGNPTFKEALSRVRRTTLDAYDHQEVPYEKLVAELRPERTASQTPFFGTMLNWVNTPESGLEFAGMPWEFVPLENSTAKFDLSLAVVEREGVVPASLEYSTDIYEETTIVRMSRHFQTLLAGIAISADQFLSELPLLEEDERRQVLVTWNQQERECPTDETLLELLEAQARKSPDTPAVIFEGESSSYRELHQQANQLAHFLKKLGVGPEVPVGVCMERSTQLVIALLGILKAGGAYVPLDPNYPAERLRYTSEDSRAPVLLTEKKLSGQLPSYTGTIVTLDAQWEEISRESLENPARVTLPENLAYVIYTSGSTGNPKGVAIRHSSAAVMLRWAHQMFSPQELSGVLASTSICFDLSVFEIFAPLSCGGIVYMAGNALELASFAEAGRITLINTVPSVMRELVRTGAIPGSVRTVNLAGEALPAELVRDVYANSSVERVFNLYGPSEDTTYSTYARMERDAVTAPIGRPIANTRAYILDEWMQPAPVGVGGELYLAGGGLARGYWRRAELTAEKFLPDLFSATEGERLYRTGDLARWRGDGNIEYAGRKDQQIKLRGYRIELGEIEAVLRQHEAVQQAIVAVQEEEGGKETRLIAYLVPTEGGRLATAALRDYVEEKLPGYMVPSAFVELPSLPLTASGKVNRKALPLWEFVAAEPEQEEPRTLTEELLAGVWSEVLGVEHIGIHANFFELGGHSLLAMQVTSRLRSGLQVELPFSAIFAAPTIHRLAAQIERSRRESIGQKLPLLKPTQQSGPHPLSFAQRRLWFMDRLHPLSTFYNISGALRLLGDLDLTALEGAWAAVAERHQVFHTQFELKDEEPMQAIENDARLKLEQEDLRALNPEEREKYLHQRIEEESQKPFVLGRAPLAKVLLLRLEEQEHVLFINMHHIISDGWSLNVLMYELTELYAAFSQGQPSPLPPLPVQYVDYARWQREYLQGAVMEKQLSYWRAQLGNVPVLELPTDWPRPAQENFRGAYYSFRIPLELAAGLRNLARSQRSTLFMLLLAAWETLLYRYSGQRDFAVGMPVANRSLPETEGLIGFFVNTLALRSDLNDDPNFAEVLQRVRRTTLEAYDHQDLPFEELVAALQPERSLGQNPLFRVMFNWVNTPRANLKLSGIKWEPVPHKHDTTHFDLTLTAGEQDGGLPAGFEYSTGLYEEPTIARMANHLLVVLNAIVQDPGCPVATMPLLTEGEREQLLFTWNQTTVEFGHLTCVHELIESQARSTPDAIAIIADDATLTYAELDRRANQIAHWLQSRGVGAETLVGVCLAPSSRMLVVLLGILKAGGAYVPLDPFYPPARLQYMAQDSGLKLLLTETSLQGRLASLPVECFYLDSLNEELAYCDATPCRKVGPENAAYVIYTSGSTGRSKGVVARHSSVANQVLWMKAAFGLTSSDRVIHKASVSFDASVAEIFAPLAAGSQVIVTRQNAQHDIDYLVRVIKNQKVTFIDLSPTLLRALLEHPEIQQCSSLRCIVSGGEALAADLERQTLKTLPAAQLYNTYGPTETTVQSTFWLCSPEPRNRSVPIGRPIANTAVYVLDSNHQPVPVGVGGELCIGGAGLARGYLDRPALTAEKFVPDAFVLQPGERIYKTGDKVRWRHNGALEFLGRTDQQAKVRGFRIEPGEIESVLLAHLKVREAAVITRESSSAGMQIAAFVVPIHPCGPAALGCDSTIPELRQHVKALLPFYMRPSRYVLMERLPLNPNGKVDRNSLAQIQLPEETAQDILPNTATEKILCNIWAEVLKREQVGVEDDFFALGGHSFLAVNLISQITRTFGRDLALDKIFQYPTPREMARFIDHSKKDTASSALVCMNKGSSELPPIYLMPPVIGNILCYSDLARSFSAQKPFYAIQALPADELKRTRVEEIAASYLQLIKKRDRQGRYELGGWSFGGMIAYEMAQQATAAGDPPAGLYLLDPPVLERLPDEAGPDEKLITLFVLTLIADFSGGKPLDMEKLQTEFGPEDRLLEGQLRKAIEFGFLPASTDVTAHIQPFALFKHNMRAAQMYRPQKYSGKTAMVLPETRRSEIWPTLLPEDVKIVRVPGNHFTILRGAKAATIAALIESGGF